MNDTDVKANEIAAFLGSAKQTNVPVVHETNVSDVLHHCDYCDFTHNDQKGMFLHRRTHEKANCEFCGKEWTLHGVGRHEVSCSENPINRALSNETSLTLNTTKCEDCDRVISNRGLPGHKKWHDRQVKDDKAMEAARFLEKAGAEMIEREKLSVIDYAAKTLFGDRIPTSKIGRIVSWMEMTKELQEEVNNAL